MNEKDDVFKKFHDSFNQMEGHFHILEQRVPVDLQMEYFKYSDKIRKERPALDENDYEVFSAVLSDEAADAESKRYALSILASSRQVKTYRLLEEYVQHSEPEVQNWAYMALMESRITLESELSDEKQIYISTGLGGKGEKLRFYVLILSVDKIPFQEYQRQVVEREFAYYLPKMDCEIERLTVGIQYVELLFLIPVRVDIKSTLDKIIYECNQYGNFLSDVYTVTNVKELSEIEIANIINKNGNSSKAGN